MGNCFSKKKSRNINLVESIDDFTPSKLSTIVEEKTIDISKSKYNVNI